MSSIMIFFFFVGSRVRGEVLLETETVVLVAVFAGCALASESDLRSDLLDCGFLPKKFRMSMLGDW